MNITLKNIKHSEFASQETHCFEATVYVDGKRSFIVKNDGQGGSNYYYPVNNKTSHREVMDMVAAIDKELGKEKIEEFDLDNCLEFVIGDLINEWLIDKQIKQLLKKVAYVKGADIYTLPTKFKPSDDMFKKLQGASWWKPEYKILNTMPIEEIRQYIR